MIKTSNILNNRDISLLEQYHNVPDSFKDLESLNVYTDEIIEIGVNLLNGNEPNGSEIDDIANKLATYES